MELVLVLAMTFAPIVLALIEVLKKAFNLKVTLLLLLELVLRLWAGALASLSATGLFKLGKNREGQTKGDKYMSRVSLQTLLERSTRNMCSGINYLVKESVLEMIKCAYVEGINVQYSSGFRSFEEQTKLFNQGRTTPGNIVTNTRAGYSNHNFGLPVDYFLVTEDGKDAMWTVNA